MGIVLKLATFCSLMFTLPAEAKRARPVEIKPLVKKGISYAPIETYSDCRPKSPCGMTVSLQATKLKGKKVLWTRELYLRMFNPQSEMDIQAVFITDMKWRPKNQIALRDEKGMGYLVDSKEGKLIEPSKSVVYMASP